MKKTLLSVAILAVISPLAAADNYFGANLSLSKIDIADSTASVDFDNKVLVAKVGTYANPNLAVEARLGLGIQDDSIGDFDLGTTHSIGAYVRGILPLGDTAEAYGIFGLTQTELDFDGEKDSDSDFSYGIGIDVDMDRDTAINFEYMSVYDDSDAGLDIEITAFNIGVTRKF